MNFITVILVAFVIFVLFFVLKFKETRHKLGFVLIFLLLLFLGVSVWKLYSTHDLNFTSYDGLINAGRVYFGWLGSIFHNILQISSYSTKLDWNVNSTINAGT